MVRSEGKCSLYVLYLEAELDPAAFSSPSNSLIQDDMKPETLLSEIHNC